LRIETIIVVSLLGLEELPFLDRQTNIDFPPKLFGKLNVEEKCEHATFLLVPTMSRSSTTHTTREGDGFCMYYNE
jgi:hypothetical protein